METMEIYTEAQRPDSFSAAERAGSPATGQIVEIKLIPVPYAGDEQAMTVIREPVSAFMLEKPA